MLSFVLQIYVLRALYSCKLTVIKCNYIQNNSNILFYVEKIVDFEMNWKWISNYISKKANNSKLLRARKFIVIR